MSRLTRLKDATVGSESIWTKAARVIRVYTKERQLVRQINEKNKNKALNQVRDALDEAGEPRLEPLFSDIEEEGDLATGNIYVLRSKSDHPFITEHRSVVHKIGVTGGDVKVRIANAKNDPTYLLSDVEIVGTFKLSNINAKRLEALIHKFFANARLVLAMKDRFGVDVESREWFLVPLPVIEEAIDKIADGTIESFRYDSASARVVAI